MIIDDLSWITCIRMQRFLRFVKCNTLGDMEILFNLRALRYVNIDRCYFVSTDELDFLIASSSLNVSCCVKSVLVMIHD